MNEYVITEKTMKYGPEKEKKLEQLKEKNTKLMKAMLLAEAKHNDKKLDVDYLKKIDQTVTEEINSVGENAGQTDGGDSSNVNEVDSTNGNGSDKGDNDKKSNDSKGKGSGNSKGNGKSK